MDNKYIRVFLYVGVGLGVYLCTKLIHYFTKKRKMEESQKEQQARDEQVLATRNLLMSTLREMGCQPEINEEDKAVKFQYQGGFFHCYVEKKSINIVYPNWEEFDISNVDINDIYATINKIHLIRGIWPRIICTVEENIATLMSVYHTIFIPEMPILSALLEAILTDLFVTRRAFYLKFQDLNQ